MKTIAIIVDTCDIQYYKKLKNAAKDYKIKIIKLPKYDINSQISIDSVVDKIEFIVDNLTYRKIYKIEFKIDKIILSPYISGNTDKLKIA